jgi:hypothetical protein
VFAFTVLALCCASCQQEKQFYPVRGQVLVDGQPAEGATVVLHPLQASDPPLLPTGVVAADGSFVLQSWLVEERVLEQGAPAGEYQVTCVWAPGDLGDGDKVPDKLLGKYGDKRSSGLKATVAAGATELPPFELQVKKE